MLQKFWDGLFKRILQTPKENYLIFVIVDSYGIVKDGMTHVVLNKFDPHTEFYQTFDIEAWIERIARKCKNACVVAFFRCNRYDFKPKEHSGGIGCE